MKSVPKKNTTARLAGLSGYTPFLVAMKNRIRAAQVKATLAANAELIHFYWDIGRAIAQCRKNKAGEPASFPGWRGHRKCAAGGEGIFRAKSEIHDSLCPRIWFEANYATACCTITRWRKNAEGRGRINGRRNFTTACGEIGSPRRPRKNAAACCTIAVGTQCDPAR